MKKKGSNAQIAKLLSESWMEKLDNDMDPNDTMNHLNRMALVTHDLADRLNAIIEVLDKKKKR
jgi:5,10-methenyltetrahydromethanopterin hydrogenase